LTERESQAQERDPQCRGPQCRGPEDAARAADAAEPIVLAELVEGGEAACYAHLVCPDCGTVVSEGHLPGCPSAPTDA